MMMVRYTSETPEQRKNRLLRMRIVKAKVLNARVKTFIEDVKNADFKQPEKTEILSHLEFLKPI